MLTPIQKKPYRRKSADEDYSRCCEPVPDRRVFEQAILRLMLDHPDWSQVRVRQRALVEMYFGEKNEYQSDDLCS